MKRKWIYGSLTCLTLVIASAICFTPKSNADTFQDTTDQDATKLAQYGMTFQAPGNSSKISRDDILTIAKNMFPVYANQATNIKVEYHMITDSNFTGYSQTELQSGLSLDVSGHLNHQPCYIVSFKGLNLHFPTGAQGSTPNIATEFNVIFDANTGNELFAFTYR